MVNYHEEIVSALSTILPTYYENTVGGTIIMPCITYLGSNNTTQIDGDTVHYGNVAFTIKVWGKDNIAPLLDYAIAVDAKMRTLGFKRTSYNELVLNDNFQLIMRFEGTSYEFY